MYTCVNIDALENSLTSATTATTLPVRIIMKYNYLLRSCYEQILKKRDSLCTVVDVKPNLIRLSQNYDHLAYLGNIGSGDFKGREVVVGRNG